MEECHTVNNVFHYYSAVVRRNLGVFNPIWISWGYSLEPPEPRLVVRSARARARSENNGNDSSDEDAHVRGALMFRL